MGRNDPDFTVIAVLNSIHRLCKKKLDILISDIQYDEYYCRKMVASHNLNSLPHLKAL